MVTGASWKSKQVGLWFFMVTAAMLFASVTSALVIRRSSASDWQPLFFPSLLWVNTGILAASSLTLEMARSTVKELHNQASRFWIFATTVLGFGFLAGQVTAWRQLAAHGVFLSSSPHSSFFYFLTALHGLHLLGGLAALSLACASAWQGASAAAQDKSLKLIATYWHFLTALWVYILVLLYWII